jgi:hypothetical protein
MSARSGPAWQVQDWNAFNRIPNWTQEVLREVKSTPEPQRGLVSWFLSLFILKFPFKSKPAPQSRSAKPKVDPYKEFYDHIFISTPIPIEFSIPPTPQTCFTCYVNSYLTRAVNYCVKLVDSWQTKSSIISDAISALSSPGRRLAHIGSVPERVRSALAWLRPLNDVYQIFYPYNDFNITTYFDKPTKLGAENGIPPECRRDFDIKVDELGYNLLQVAELFEAHDPNLKLPKILPEVVLQKVTEALEDVEFAKVMSQLGGLYRAMIGCWVNEILKVEIEVPIKGVLNATAELMTDPVVDLNGVEFARLDCDGVRVVSSAIVALVNVVTGFIQEIDFFSDAPAEGIDEKPVATRLWEKVVEDPRVCEFDPVIQNNLPEGWDYWNVVKYVKSQYVGRVPPLKQ